MSTNINTNLFSIDSDRQFTDFSEFFGIAVEPISTNSETTSIGVITVDGGIVNLTPTQDPGNGEESNPPYNLGELDLNNGGGLRVDQTVGSSDPVDLYQFTLNNSGDYEFTLDNLSSDANIVLLDSNGDAIEQSELEGTLADSFNVDLDAGTYYVGVYSNDGIDTNYSLTINDIPDPNSTTPEQPPITPDEPDSPEPQTVIPDQDPGFNFDEAYDLGILNTSLNIQEVVGGNDPGDIYQFTVDNAGEYSFSLDGLTADAHMGIIDSDGNLIISSENSGTVEEFISTPLSEGTYYLSIPSVDGVTTNYNLHLSSSSSSGPPVSPDPDTNSPTIVTPTVDPGWNFTTAYDLGDIDGSLTVQDAVNGSDQVDFYQFSVDESRDYIFTLDELSADVDMGLYSSYGELLDFSYNVGSLSESINMGLDAGTYFVGVLSYDLMDTTYELTIAEESSIV